ncbi:sulfotransferase [Altererythrobacter sp. MF3-039]|uniref:sulfotransferase n=1 Tax=Altererythrobacter sp. MF3-039 TaxID=3252901 RepID=UPI00390C9C7D
MMCSQSSSHAASRDDFVVVTGMHRSHTSLLGRMLAASGIKFHHAMVGEHRSNPYGHYEDIEFMQLQEDALRSVGARWYRNIDSVRTFDHSDRDRASDLVLERTEELGPGWAFKVPHSSLFLEEWASFKNSRFLLIFREPAPVLSSMYRRMGWQFYARPDAIVAMARAYAIYNERLAEHKRRYPDRTFLIDSRDMLADPHKVLSAANVKLDMKLSLDWQPGDLVDQDIVSANSQPLEAWATRRLARLPRVKEAYRSVQLLADTGDRLVEVDVGRAS